ncbi:MAG: GNAT family N-acetyltransferase [Chloroflexi bacterium]|nr:GNAT family N-acetyltransferase [Chloroflexota bacterium]
MLHVHPMVTEDLIARAPTMADAEIVTAVIAAADIAETGASEATLEETLAEWQSPDFDLAQDALLILSPDDRALGYADVWDKARPVTPWLSVFLPPGDDALAVGARLMTWGEARAQQAIGRAPEGTRVALRCGAGSTYEPLKQVFENAAFVCVRHSFRMVIELDSPPPQPVWPEGITVRSAVMGQDERAILQAQRESFRDHWGYVEEPFEDDLRRWLYKWQAEGNFDPSLWLLAMDGDTIAGISLCRPHLNGQEDMGWVSTLGVTRPYRRRGIGLALLHHTFQEFYRRGKRRVGLGVDASSLTGAVRLYEQAGMHVALRFDLYEKELRPGVDITRQDLDEA